VVVTGKPMAAEYASFAMSRPKPKTAEDRLKTGDLPFRGHRWKPSGTSKGF
jgi:hypothetical protein